MRTGLALPLTAALLGTTPAAAQAPTGPQTSSLSWVRLPGAEECIASRALAEAVEQRLGRSVFVSAADADMAVEGRVERTDDGFRAAITAAAADGSSMGERELPVEGDDCTALVEPLVLVVAVMIDPDAALSPREPEEPADAAPQTDPPEARAEVETADRADTDPPIVTEVERRPGWRVSFDGAIGFGFGVLPAPAPGIAGTVAIEPPSFPTLELDGALYPPVAEATDVGDARFALAYVGALICPLAADHAFLESRACTGFHVGAVRQDGPAPGDDGELVIAQLLVRLRVAARIADWLSFFVRAGALVPLRREPFDYTDPTGASRQAFTMAPFAATLDAGFTVHLPEI